MSGHDLWREVLAGRFRVVERRDEGGRVWFRAVPAAEGDGPTPSRVQRDEQLARLVLRGLSNKQIASELDLAPSTVTEDLHQLLARLCLRSRFELAAILGALAGAGQPDSDLRAD